MIVGFSGFGFPKAHGAAFGLLAYQSTWLRVHYTPEFLCALLNEQPMGFYASDTLVHEAQRRGIELLPADVNESAAECTVAAAPTAAPVESSVDLVSLSRTKSTLDGSSAPMATANGDGQPPAVASGGSVRLGLGYVNGVRADEVAALVVAREEGGRFRSLADLASRAGAGRPSLEKLAWAGACDALAGIPAEAAAGGARATATPETAAAGGARGTVPPETAAAGGARGTVPPETTAAGGARRAALWQLGVAAPGAHLADGTQLALPLDVPAPPVLRHLEPWEAMVADYATTGLTIGAHPMALLRERLPAGSVSCRDLETLRHEAPVRIGGLVVARQRPGTAKGIVFILLEDEFGTINLIVPPDVYERRRLTVRAEPLIIARGRLEKLPIAGGALNVFVHDLEPLAMPGEIAGVVELAERRAAAAAVEAPAAREAEAADPSAILADFRGVAPAVQSFAAGRRR